MSRACEMCGASGGFRLLGEGRDCLLGDSSETFRAVTCMACGFSFLEHRPDDLSRYYPDRYFGATALGSARGLSWMARWLVQHEASALERLVPAAKNILEIGPGNGGFLNALAEAFPRAQLRGFDISQGAMLEKKLQPRIAVRYAPELSEAGFAPGQFDLIVMRHVLEHVPGVRAFLGQLRLLGADACALYVKVPNLSSLAARVFGRYWYGLDFPRHLSYFTPQHLIRLLEEGGFRPEQVNHDNDAIDWAGSLRFLLAGAFGIPFLGGKPVLGLFLGVRIGLLPLGTLARLLRRSSRIWVLARKTEI